MIPEKEERAHRQPSLMTNWMEGVGCSNVEGRKWGGMLGNLLVQWKEWGL